MFLEKAENMEYKITIKYNILSSKVQYSMSTAREIKRKTQKQKIVVYRQFVDFSRINSRIVIV